MQSFGIEQYIANLSIDCVIFGYEDDQLKVLLGKLKYGKNLYNLPGGHILKTESVDDAATRLLQERTQLKNIHLNQFKVFGNANRIVNTQYKKLIHQELSNRYSKREADWILDRFVCVGYYALVEISKVKPIVGELDQDVLKLNQDVFKNLTCPKKLEIVKQASHLFEEPGALKQVSVMATNWFKKYLEYAFHV